MSDTGGHRYEFIIRQVYRPRCHLGIGRLWSDLVAGIGSPAQNPSIIGVYSAAMKITGRVGPYTQRSHLLGLISVLDISLSQLPAAIGPPAPESIVGIDATEKVRSPF